MVFLSIYFPVEIQVMLLISEKGYLVQTDFLLTRKGSLILCQHGDRRIASIRNLNSEEKTWKQ